MQSLGSTSMPLLATGSSPFRCPLINCTNVVPHHDDIKPLSSTSAQFKQRVTPVSPTCYTSLLPVRQADDCLLLTQHLL